MDYPKVFISYRKSDPARLDEARDIRKVLQQELNFETWLDEDLKGGDIWRKEIEEKLEWADCFLLILHSDIHSGNVVLDEIGFALQALKSGKYKHVVCLNVENNLRSNYLAELDNKVKQKFPNQDLQQLDLKHYLSKSDCQWKQDLGTSFYPILKEQQGKAIAEARKAGADKIDRAARVYEGLIFLLRPFSFLDREIISVLKKIRSKLNISVSDERSIIEILQRNNIVIKTGDYLLVHDDNFGRKCITEAFFGDSPLMNIRLIQENVPGKTKTILSSLAEIDAPQVKKELTEYLKRIGTSIIEQNNDQRLDSLNLLEEFAYRVPEPALEIINVLIDPKNEKNPTKYKIPFVRLGWEHTYILDKCLDVLNQYNIRYGTFHKCFSILIKIYTYKTDQKEYEKVRKRAGDIMLEVANYNLKIIRPNDSTFWGYGFQSLIFDEIKKLLRQRDDRLFELGASLIRKLLETEAEGTYWNHKTVTFKRGPLALTKRLVKLRKELIDEIISYIKRSKIIKRRLRCIDLLENATTYPMQGYDALELMIMKNTATILKFYDGLNPKRENPSILQEIDGQLSWVKKRFDLYKGTNQAVAVRLYKRAERIQKKIRSDNAFKVYRLFVNNSRYDFADDGGWQFTQERRNKENQDILNTISSKNLATWIRALKTAISTYFLQNDHDFSNLRFLLRKIGETNPEVGIKTFESLSKSNIKPVGFLTDILMGIKISNKAEYVNLIANRWMKSKDFERIKEIPFFYSWTNETILNEDDFKIFNRLICLRLSIVNRSELDHRIWLVLPALYKNKKKELYRILKEIIKRLPIEKMSEFSQALGMEEHRGNIVLSQMPDDIFRLLINKYLHKNRLNHNDAQILAAYGKKDVFRLIDFLKKRVFNRPRKENGLLDTGYDAIPYHLDEMGKIIKQDKDYSKVIKKIIDEWILSNDGLLSYEGRDFIQKVSSELDPQLKAILMEYIRANKNKAKAVLSILSEFESDPSIDDLCIEAIKRYSDKDIKGMVSTALYASGGVTGEYGFYNAHKARRDRIVAWKHNNNKRLKCFIEEMNQALTQDMEKEKKDVEVNEELEKRGIDHFRN